MKACWDNVLAEAEALGLTPEVIADCRARDELGRQRYGVRLHAHNGRDALKDLYEELLDALVYCQQVRDEAPMSIGMYVTRQTIAALARGVRVMMVERGPVAHSESPELIAVRQVEKECATCINDTQVACLERRRQVAAITDECWEVK